MSEVAVAVRSMRKRMGQTMVEFASRLGTDHSTISKYEAGKLDPSRSMLLLLLTYAEGEERGAILDALGVQRSQQEGWTDDALRAALGVFEDYLAAGGRKSPRGDRARHRFIEMAKAIAGDTSRGIPLWLVEVMEFWLANRDERETAQFFEHLPIYLDVQLKAAHQQGTDTNQAARAKTRRKSR